MLKLVCDSSQPDAHPLRNSPSFPRHCVIHSRQNCVVIKAIYSQLCHSKLRKLWFRLGHSTCSEIISGSQGFLKRKGHYVHRNNEI